MKKITPLFLLQLVSFCVQAQIGKVGINTTTPQAMLHVKDSSVLFTGAATLPVSAGNPPVSGAGTRMMWYPDKAAFRAGNVNFTQWDKDNIGDYSFATGRNTRAIGDGSTAMGEVTLASGPYCTAMGRNTQASNLISTAMGNFTEASGYSSTAMGSNTEASGYISTAMGSNTTASGDNSTAMGLGTIASGDYSTAMGFNTDATGDYSTAMGLGTKASGVRSTAMGSYTTASGVRSTAIGFNTTASAYGSLSIGQYNDSIISSNKTNWVATDPVFIIGNGLTDIARSNALTILKNGKTGINTAAPLAGLHIKGIAPTFDSHLRLESAGSNTDYMNMSYDGSTKFRNFGVNDEFQFRNAASTINCRIFDNGNMTIAGLLTQSSDERLKENIVRIPNALNKVMQLNGYQYNWKPELHKDSKQQIGLLAQNVETILPQLVATDAEGMKSIAYQNIVPVLIEAIKELKKEIDELKRQKK